MHGIDALELVREPTMTVSTKTHHRPARPHPHLGFSKLASAAAWLLDRWAYTYQRGQLGPQLSDVRHDRRREPYDVMLPRIY
jgi:hypothetical protein